MISRPNLSRPSQVCRAPAGSEANRVGSSAAMPSKNPVPQRNAPSALSATRLNWDDSAAPAGSPKNSMNCLFADFSKSTTQEPTLCFADSSSCSVASVSEPKYAMTVLISSAISCTSSRPWPLMNSKNVPTIPPIEPSRSHRSRIDCWVFSTCAAYCSTDAASASHELATLETPLTMPSTWARHGGPLIDDLCRNRAADARYLSTGDIERTAGRAPGRRCGPQLRGIAIGPSTSDELLNHRPQHGRRHRGPTTAWRTRRRQRGRARRGGQRLGASADIGGSLGS